MSWRKLSAVLEASGRPIPPLGLSRMTAGERRVDVDELVALAAVLGVTPTVLLAGPAAATVSEHAALRAASDLADELHELARALKLAMSGPATAPPRRWSFTRDELADIISHLEASVPASGPAAGRINAGSMADAIIVGLAEMAS